MANEIKVTVTGDDKLSAVSKKAKDNATKDAGDVAKAFESSGKRVVNEFGLWQDAAGKWRNETGRFASDAEKAAAGVESAVKKISADGKRESHKFGLDFGDAFDGVKDGARVMAGAVSTAIGTAVGVIGAQVISQVSQPFTEFVGGAVDAASQLADSMNAVNRVFGTSAQPILDWGDNVANMFGLSQRAFNQLAVPLGAMLKNTGMDMDAVAENTLGLTMRAADMASVFGGEVTDAMQAIQAGLRGEADPLERYGVGLSAAAVEAHALSMGLGKAEVDLEKVHIAQLGAAIANTKYQEEVRKTGRGSLEAAQKEKALISANEALEKAMAGGKVELTDQEKMLARVSLLMQQTADTTGDHIAASGEHANATKNANAQMEEEQALLGQALIPLSMKATQVKLALAKALVEHGIPAFEKFQGFVGDKVIPRLRELAGWVREEGIPAIQDLAGWVSENVVPKLQQLGDWITSEGVPAFQQFSGWLAEHMSPNLEKVKDILIDLIPKVKEMGETFVEKFREMQPHLQGFAEFIMDKVIPAVLFLVDKLTLVLVPAFKAVMESYALTVRATTDVVNAIRWIGDTAAAVGGVIKDAFVGAINFVIDAWNGLSLPGVNIGLPGGKNVTLFPGWDSPNIDKIGAPNASGGDKQFGGGGVRRFATGGLVTSPTLGLVGEAGPEAVIPLNKMGAMGGATFNVYALTKADAARGIADAITEARRLGYMR